jgi:hypothetical protein
VDDPSPINSKIKINNSSIPDDLNNIQPEHSEITLNDSFLLDLGNLETGPTQIKLNVRTRGEQKTDVFKTSRFMFNTSMISLRYIEKNIDALKFFILVFP